MNKAHSNTISYQCPFNGGIHPTDDIFVFTLLGVIPLSLISQDHGQAEATKTYFSVKVL